MARSRSDRPHAISFVESYLPDDRVLVKLIGELDATSLPGIERKLHELAESADTTIDLARTTFSDLSSVRMLVACRERARVHGHVLEAVNAPPHVERMLQMLERGHYWRPARAARRDEGPEYTIPGPTTADAERSQPESEQIVRLQCPACGEQAFRPEHAAERACEKCGVELQVVAVFRDRRRRDAPVDHDRRQ